MHNKQQLAATCSNTALKLPQSTSSAQQDVADVAEAANALAQTPATSYSSEANWQTAAH